MKAGGLFTEQEVTNAAKHPNAGLIDQLVERILARREAVIGMARGIWDRDQWRQADRVLRQQPPWEEISNRIAEQGSGEPSPERERQLKESLQVLTNYLDNLERALEPHLRHAGVSVGFQVQEAVLAAAIAERVKNEHDAALKGIADLRAALDAGIARVEAIKRDTVLQGSFGEHVGRLRSGAQVAGFVWMGAFVGILLGAAWFGYRAVAPHDTWGLVGRLLVAAPAAVLAYFCFGQYKQQRLAEIKYGHLVGFLRGGAKEIGEMLVGSAQGGGADVARELNKRLAEILLDVDDLANATRKAGLPTQELTKVLGQIQKTAEALGPFTKRGG